MKKLKLSILLPLMILTGCYSAQPLNNEIKNSPAVIVSPTYKTINSLKENVIVSISATVSHKFDEEYRSLNYSSSYSGTRQFGLVKNEDGTFTKACILNNGKTTYLENSDGSTYFEALNSNNEVTKIAYTSLGAQVRYNGSFENPFDYVSLSDFDNTNSSFESSKAEFVSEKLLGFGWGVESCSYSIDNNHRITSLEINYLPRNDAIQTSSSLIRYESDLTSTISFTYPETSMKHMTASSEENSELKTAFESMGSNYTITSYSDSSDVMIKTYVTENGIYQHYTGNQENLSEGDVYLSGRNLYQYTVVDGFSIYDIGAKTSDLLPSFDSLSTSLFHKETSNTFSLIDDARYLNASSFVTPYYDLGSSYTGGYSSVILKDGKVDKTTTSITISGGSIVNVVNEYSNYGTTSMPTYFEFNA